jgi:hypothetical protein
MAFATECRFSPEVAIRLPHLTPANQYPTDGEIADGKWPDNPRGLPSDSVAVPDFQFVLPPEHRVRVCTPDK